MDSQPSPTIAELFDLSGRAALVTGGAGYLGSAMCHALAEAGASVVVSSRTVQRAGAVAESLPRRGTAAHHAVALDHKDPQSLADGFARAVALAGRLDILVNNATGGRAEDWKTLSAESFNDQLANATGYFLLARHLRDHVVEQARPASIILLGSMYGLVGSYPDAYEGICPASSAAYHALKGGVVQLTRHLAVYWASDRVRVNCLSPGPFPAPQVSEELVQRLSAKCPLGRMGLPHELKGAVVFLAGDASSYMTGQNLVIDGGWTAW